MIKVCNVSYWLTRTSGCMWLVCHRSLSETADLHPHFAQGCWHAVITGVDNLHPHMSVSGDNTTPISNDGVAWLGPMMQSWVWVLAGVDLRRTDHVQWGRPDSDKVIKQALPTTLGALQPWTRPGLMESKLQPMTTKSNTSCECSGYYTPNGNINRRRPAATKKYESQHM